MALEHSRLLAASLTAAVFGASCSTSGESTPTPVSETPTSSDTPSGGSAENRQEPQDPVSIEERVDRERRRALAERGLEVAKALRLNGDLPSAKSELLKILELMRSDSATQAAGLVEARDEARSLLAAVQAELGEPVGSPQTWQEEQQRLRTIGEERARADVMSAMQRAQDKLKDATSTQVTSAAIEELRVAALTIETKSDMNWGDLPAQVKLLQAEAAQVHDTLQRSLQASENARQQALLRAQNREAAELLTLRVENLLRESQKAFRERRFDRSSELAEQALALDRHHRLAAEMLTAARKAARQTSNEEYWRIRALEVRKMLEAAEELKTPQTEILHPDAETWARANGRVKSNTPTKVLSEEDRIITDKVKSKPIGTITFNADNGGYLEVVKLLQALTEVQIMVTQRAKEAIEAASSKLEGTLAGTETLANVLDTMVAKNKQLSWTVRFGLVVIGDAAEGVGPIATEIYPVRDLLFDRTDFIPPSIKEIPGNNQDENPRSGGEEEEPRPAMTTDHLTSLLTLAAKVAVKRDVFTEEGNKLEVDDTGLLVVTAPIDAHQAIGAALRDMRRFQTAIVSIDAKFLTLSRNFLQEVGIDFRGLGGSGNKGDIVTLDDLTNGLVNNTSRGLDNGGTQDPAANPLAGAFYNDGGDGDFRGRTENIFGTDLGRALSPTGGLTAGWTLIGDTQLNMILRAVEKREDSEVVNSQVLSIVDNARGHVAVINQTSYVRDFDVEVAQSSFIADPIVDVIQDGLVLDVQPIILNDRKHMLLSLTPTVAELQRPIQTFTTSLAGSTLPVTIQLPTLTVTTFATTVTVPDGGSVMLGGLRKVLTKERRAEIPLLSSLPLVSFFFKQEGSVDENQNLMVLVRAKITDIEEIARAK